MNGRPFDPKHFEEELRRKAMKLAIDALERKARGAAATIVDPETGRHADVFVDRTSGDRVVVRTRGSPAFARLLETRLGVGVGEVRVEGAVPGYGGPKVYLAHATDDKAMVRPIAEFLMANGVEVWFDEWEIEVGDSLRQRMEEGLGAMTHFMVVLTPTSITKPWVAREIDVGMVRMVGGESRMVPVAVGLEHHRLTPFLQTLLYVRLDPDDPAALKGLVDRLHGVSRKPPLGSAPRYVASGPPGLEGWSPAAIAIGRHFVEASVHARVCDPVLTVPQLVEATGLDAVDVRLGVLDLVEAGHLREMNVRGHFTAELPLFVDFDEAFMEFSPLADAVVVANAMVNGEERAVDAKVLAGEFDWSPRRMNSAICYLLRTDAIDTRTALASGPWRAVQLIRTDRTIRFARSHA